MKLKKKRSLESNYIEGVEEENKLKRKKKKGVNPLAAKKKKKKYGSGGAFGKQTDQSKVYLIVLIISVDMFLVAV